ncbi:MAG: leucine-rich repeat domain-containing protein [Flavobacteriales bacterium]|nr:leucine-rich repeat domain-containing protein [Flavobacteriales bacterium]
MRYFFLSFSWFVLLPVFKAQNTYETFYSVDEARASNSNFLELNLSQQGLVKLPEGIYSLSNLKSIDLGNNPLLNVSQCLDSLKRFPYLETIKLNGLQLKYIPFELLHLTQLKYLFLERNEIETIPEGIRELDQLKGLYLSDNDIDYIQPGFMHMPNLETIDLRGNREFDEKSFLYFSSLMPGLKELKLNAEEGLNEEITSLFRIKKLTLYRLSASGGYEYLSSLIDLEELTIEQGVEVDYQSLFQALASTKLKKLTISDNSLIKLDDGIVNLISLERLELSGWNFNALPESIRSLEHLTEVKFHDTPNMNNEESLGRLNTGKILSLEMVECNRKSFPNEISSFQNLEVLNLSGNGLTGFEGFTKPGLKTLTFFDHEIPVTEINQLRERMPDCVLSYEEEDRQGPATLAVKNVLPPSAPLDMVMESYQLDAQKGKTITYNTGSQIIVPENAFLDKNGQVVKGNVTLSYREFNDPIEIAFSGIPMGYDSAGTINPFQSGGMIEIRATRNGEPLYVNPQSKITVNMVSNTSDASFNLYSMDDGEEWVYKGKDSIAALDGSLIVNKRFEYDNRNATIPMPVIPVVKSGLSLEKGDAKWKRKKGYIQIYATNYNYRLISFLASSNKDIKAFTELRELNRYDWKIDAQDLNKEKHRYDSLIQFVKGFNNRMNNWRNSANDIDTITKEYKLLAGANLIEDFWITPNNKADNFLLKFLICGDTTSFEVVPAVSSSNPKIIQRKFKTIFNKYDKALEKRRGKWAEIDLYHGDYLKQYRQDMEKYQADLIEFNRDRDGYLAGLRQEISNYEASSYNFTRSFSIDGFGYWNCDVFKRMESPKPLLAKMVGQEDEKLNIKELMVADITKNGVLRYSTPGRQLYDAKSKNAIIAFLAEGEIALLTPDAVESIPLYTHGAVAKFEVFKTDEITIGEIKKRIGMPVN